MPADTDPDKHKRTPPAPEETEIPRWIQVPVGLILSGILLLCGAGSITLILVVASKQAPIATSTAGMAIGVTMLVVTVWMLEKCFRLITGRRKKGGLMGPLALRSVAFLFLLLPFGGLFTGYYRTNGMRAVVLLGS
jgi:hypothetical protein